MPTDTNDDTAQSDTEVYRCRHCGEEVGTSGGKPETECPTCNADEWRELITDGGKSASDTAPDSEQSDTDTGQETVFYLCVTCGRLKAEDLFETGDCTCKDCYRDGRSDVRYRKRPDADGFIVANETEVR